MNRKVRIHAQEDTYAPRSGETNNEALQIRGRSSTPCFSDNESPDSFVRLVRGLCHHKTVSATLRFVRLNDKTKLGLTASCDNLHVNRIRMSQVERQGIIKESS